MNRLCLPVAALFSLAGCLQPNEAPPLRILTAAQQRSDLLVLRTTLKETHPGLYWYNQQQDLDRYFDSVGASFNQNLRPAGFFKILLPLIAKIRCVHTSVRLPEETDGSGYRISNCLPFDFYITRNQVGILRDFSGHGLAGYSLFAIGGTPVGDIKRKLMACIPADGYNETFKYDLLSNGGFREGYALFYGQPHSFRVTVTDPVTNKLRVIAVDATTPVQLRERRPGSSRADLLFNGRTAILTVGTFAISTNYFRDTIAAVFKKIAEKKASRLIIDLRGNTGGNNTNITELFAYLADRAFLHLKGAEMTAQQFTFRKYIRDLDDLTPLKKPPGKNGLFRVDSLYPGTAVRQPVKHFGFRGPVVLLVSGETSSAASEFVSLCKSTRRATLVGEEAGGCYYGATGGQYIHLRLPESGIEVRIPMIRIFTAVKKDLATQPEGRGAMPDIEVIPSLADRLSGHDIQMETALKGQ